MKPAAKAGDIPFANSTNWGGTGLLETPNARVLPDGVFRLGYAQADPFGWYGVGMGVFPGLEVSGRYTEISNIPSGLGEDFGANKDKALDIKYQIVPESKMLPALAVGINDFHGTRLFPSEYLVVSRQIFPFDFTLGVGTGRLGKGATEIGDASFGFLSKKGLESIGVFGGIEWAVTDKLNVLCEYNPIDYTKDKRSAKGVPEGASSPINIGARYQIFEGFDVGLSWQRGDTIGFMGHMALEMGKSLIPKRSNPPRWKTKTPPPFSEENAKERLEQIQKEVLQEGFKDVAVFTDGKTLTAEFENTRYLSHQRAAGRVLRILLAHSPEEVDTISAVLKRRRMPFLKVSVNPVHFDRFLMGELQTDVFEELVSVETVSSGYAARDGIRPFATVRASSNFDYEWGIKPEFETFFNDPSGAFKFRAGIKPYAEATLWKGADLTASYMIPFYSNIESSNVPPPDAVRSDAWKYMGEEAVLDRLVFDQAFRLTNQSLARFSTGYFEKMYAGVGGEVLAFPGDGTLAVGAESDWVQKRVPGQAFELYSDDSYYTVLGNLYYLFSPFDMTFHVQYGRFLGEDVGWRLEASREYDTGLVVGAWYSFTDTDHFLTTENRDYHDKGVFMKVPARMFSLRETRTLYDYSFKPWTRDVGATVRHWQELYDIASDLMPARFSKNPSDFRK